MQPFSITTQNKIDILLPLTVILITSFGILNIFSVQFDNSIPFSALLLRSLALKQLIWASFASILVYIIFQLKIRIIFLTPHILYMASLFLLILAIVIGKSVSGHNAWVSIGGLRLQPSEPAKITTSLMISEIISDPKFRTNVLMQKLKLLGVIGLPILLILLQGDAGSAIIFFAFSLVFLIEKIFTRIILLLAYCGFVCVASLVIPQTYLLIFFIIIFSLLFALYYTKPYIAKMFFLLSLATGLCIYGTSYIMNSILKPHQKNRITAWLEPNSDPLGIGWNINQSKIAIGSGGFLGKGILNGSQTRYGFVPEQHTDFIFCTVGEEYGFVGSIIFIILYTFMIFRIFYIADRQNLKFSKIYGQCIGSLLFAHFSINIGMTIGLFPTIGIPLPFMSYGGSALTSFILMVGILLKLDTDRTTY